MNENQDKKFDRENIDNVDIFSLHTPLERISMPIDFPYSTISSFVRVFKDFVHFRVYPKFNGVIYGGFDKAIQMFIQQEEAKQNGNDIVEYGYPIFSYDVTIDEVDRQIDSYWRTTNLFNKLSTYVYKNPVYMDDDLKCWITFRRIKGKINAKAFCSSQPQEIDIQMNFIDRFLGTNRWVVMPIHSYTVVPKEFIFTTVHGKRISKLLSEHCINKQFISDINKNVFYIYNDTNPIVRLTSVSTSNNLYGGKGVPEFILNLSFDFEIDIPQYIIIESIYRGRVIININVDFQHNKDYGEELREIFGKPDRTNSTDDIVVCENGIVKGWSGFKIKEDTNKFLLSDIYPSPRGFFPEEKELHIYVYTPIGLFNKENFNITKIEGKDDYLFELNIPETNFQEGDLIAMYLFYPKDIINEE